MLYYKIIIKGVLYSEDNRSNKNIKTSLILTFIALMMPLRFTLFNIKIFFLHKLHRYFMHMIKNISFSLCFTNYYTLMLQCTLIFFHFSLFLPFSLKFLFLLSYFFMIFCLTMIMAWNIILLYH